MSRRLRSYVVTFRESALVTELVEAETAAEAVRLVKWEGLGERVGFEIDETRMPTAHSARLDEPRATRQPSS